MQQCHSNKNSRGLNTLHSHPEEPPAGPGFGRALRGD